MEVDFVEPTPQQQPVPAPAQLQAAPGPATQQQTQNENGREENKPNTINDDRKLLYSLIIRQLHDDGFGDLSNSLSLSSGVGLDSTLPSSQLSRLVDSALAQLIVFESGARRRMELGRPEDAAAAEAEMEAESEAQEGEAQGQEAGEEETQKQSHAHTIASAPLIGMPANLLDLTATRRISTLSTPFPEYSSRFGYTHNGAATCAAFSSDGALVATGSRDSGIKLLDVARMRAAPALEATSRVYKKKSGFQPLLRTYFDHQAGVTDLAFHPFEPFLLSGSLDHTLKFFNYSSALTGVDDQSAISRKSTKVLALENSAITSLSFHPSGDWVLVGTEENFCRLYDTQSFSAYTSPDFVNFHSGQINAVRFHPVRGSTYATAGADGTVKLWDGVNNQCIRTLTMAHSGAEVSSVEYSPSGKYLLTCGLDSTAKLWDLATDRCLMTYTGVKHQHSHFSAQFEHSGEFVLCGDEASTGLAVFDTRTSEMVRRLDFHAKAIRAIGVSPTETAFITCGDDNKCRFWAV